MFLDYLRLFLDYDGVEVITSYDHLQIQGFS